MDLSHCFGIVGKLMQQNDQKDQLEIDVQLPQLQRDRVLRMRRFDDRREPCEREACRIADRRADVRPVHDHA